MTHVFSIASGVEGISRIVAKLFLRRKIASRIASAFFPSVAKASEQVLTAVEDILPLPKAVVQKQEELLQETCQHTMQRATVPQQRTLESEDLILFRATVATASTFNEPGGPAVSVTATTSKTAPPRPLIAPP